MKTTQNILIAIFFSMSFFTYGQVGEIKGVVMDLETGETMIGATVSVYYAGNLIGTATDINGRFNLKPLVPATYTMTVRSLNKKKQQFTMEVKANQIAFRDTVFLSDSSMDEIEIVAIKLYDPEETSKPTLTEEELKTMADIRNPKKLAVIASDGAITLSESDNKMHFRGSRGGTVVTYLDGLKITGTVPSYPAAAIKSFAVYTGGLPAKYGDTVGGVIEIQTKSYFDLYNQEVARQNSIKSKK